MKRSTRCSSPKSGYRPQPRRAGSMTSSVRYSRISSTMAIRLPLRGMTRVIAVVRGLGATLVSALISLIAL